MIITCQNCSSRLQVDETKIPTRPFIIRCPKCNSSVEAGSPTSAAEQTPPAVSNSPAAENPALEPTPSVEQPKPAPLFGAPSNTTDTNPEPPATERLVELLSGLLTQSATPGRGVPNARRSWDPRKALVCVTQDHREMVARSLTANGYQVFVAQDTRQAVDRMRENELDVVLLDPRFDTAEQGAIFVTREVNILRPPQRRRLFFVLLSPSLRTMDAHSAFLNNVNGIINVNEIEELPELMERRFREFNALYKEFNSALGISAL